MLSKLFSLFYSCDARLFIKMYIQKFLRALITNLLSYLQISIWRIQWGIKFWKNSNSKFKIAVQYNGKLFEKTPIFLEKIGIKGLVGPLITNLLSDSKNSKWRIQYDGQNFEKFQFFGKNWYIRIFRVADYEFPVRFGKFKITVQYNGQNFEKILIFWEKFEIWNCRFNMTAKKLVFDEIWWKFMYSSFLGRCELIWRKFSVSSR